MHVHPPTALMWTIYRHMSNVVRISTGNRSDRLSSCRRNASELRISGGCNAYLFSTEVEVNHVLPFLSVAIFKYQLIHPRGSTSAIEVLHGTSKGSLWTSTRWAWGYGERGRGRGFAISLRAFHEAHVKRKWISGNSVKPVLLHIASHMGGGTRSSSGSAHCLPLQCVDTV